MPTGQYGNAVSRRLTSFYMPATETRQITVTINRGDPQRRVAKGNGLHVFAHASTFLLFLLLSSFSPPGTEAAVTTGIEAGEGRGFRGGGKRGGGGERGVGGGGEASMGSGMAQPTIKYTRAAEDVPHPVMTDGGIIHLKTPVDVVVGPNEEIALDTGVEVLMPRGYCGRLVLRQSAYESNLSRLDLHCGFIDGQSKGTIKLIIQNRSRVKIVHLQKGIAYVSLVPIKVFEGQLEETYSLAYRPERRFRVPMSEVSVVSAPSATTTSTTTAATTVPTKAATTTATTTAPLIMAAAASSAKVSSNVSATAVEKKKTKSKKKRIKEEPVDLEGPTKKKKKPEPVYPLAGINGTSDTDDEVGSGEEEEEEEGSDGSADGSHLSDEPDEAADTDAGETTPDPVIEGSGTEPSEDDDDDDDDDVAPTQPNGI